jgi:hypothetical protein
LGVAYVFKDYGGFEGRLEVLGEAVGGPWRGVKEIKCSKMGCKI